jgi:hypothetical protein
MSVLLACALASAVQAPSITFSGPPGPAKAVLAQISKLAGQNLVTSQATAEDVLYVRVKEMSLERLQDLVSRATGNVWRKDSEGLRLVRDAEADKAREQAAREARAKIIETALEKGTSPGGRILNPEALQGMPSEKAARDLAKVVGARALAQIGPDQRVVFSSHPTRMQRPFPASVAAIARELALAVQNQKDRPGPDPTTGVRMLTPNSETSADRGDLRNGLGKTLLIVRTVGREALTLEMLVTDGKGLNLAQANSAVALTPSSNQPELPKFEAEFQPSAATQALAKVLFGAPRVQASENATIYAVTVSGNPLSGPAGSLLLTGDPMPETPADLGKLLVRPDQHDPTRFGLAEALDGFERGKNIVACLPDGAIVTVLQAVREAGNAARLWSGLARELELRADAEDWVIRPRDLDHARASRINRVALARLAQAIDPDGLVRVSDMAAFASAQPKAPSLQEYDGLLLRLLAPGSLAEIASRRVGSAWTMLRLLGALSNAQRQALAAGRPLNLGSMPADAQNLVVEDVFHSTDGPMILTPEAGGPRRVSLQALGSAGAPIVFAGFGLSLATERTEVLGGGLDPRSTLSIHSVFDQGVVVSNAKTGLRRFQTAQSLGMMGTGSNAPESDRFKLVNTGNYTLRFTFGERITMVRGLSDAWAGGRLPAVAFDQLPADFRMKVDQARNLRGTFQMELRSTGPATPPP